MTIVKKSRVIGWLLLASLLINAFACTLQHASHVGFELAMGQGVFCLTDDGDAASGKAGSLGGDFSHSTAQPFDCPLCSSVLVGIVLLLGLAWLGGRSAAARPVAAHERTTPRLHWPSLNPRAP
ncbi:DUF2946 domain-containing protein [Stutzerimonas stutzeri]|uniref:DUF2946 domain-containing protein n=1 Tax=Stutzerimonas sp. S1 TaxID=3030652 RepID=UPI00222493A0|nr:DUF2946 domain-containing protein [Stutzerimonas sp. S1]MCW3148427.1 DUF2946 domain-containing protein [Stutzerimonas sp. S1]